MEIEKNIVPPEVARFSPVWGEMEVGDSVKAPLNGATSTSECNAYQSAWQYGKRHGMRFTGRVEGDGVRIWRVE